MTKELSNYLLEQVARSQDPKAWGDLVNRFTEELYRVAFRTVGNHSIAEDVVQETWLVVRDAASRYKPYVSDPERAVRNWLVRICINIGTAMMKKQRRREAILREKKKDVASVMMNKLESVDASESTEKAEDLVMLREAMQDLSKTHRTTLSLRFISDMSYEEMSEELSCNITSVRKRVSRALNAIKPLLSRRGVMASSLVLFPLLLSQTVSAAEYAMVSTRLVESSNLALSSTQKASFFSEVIGVGVKAKAIAASITVLFVGVTLNLFVNGDITVDAKSTNPMFDEKKSIDLSSEVKNIKAEKKLFAEPKDLYVLSLETLGSHLVPTEGLLGGQQDIDIVLMRSSQRTDAVCRWNKDSVLRYFLTVKEAGEMCFHLKVKLKNGNEAVAVAVHKIDKAGEQVIIDIPLSDFSFQPNEKVLENRFPNKRYIKFKRVSKNDTITPYNSSKLSVSDLSNDNLIDPFIVLTNGVPFELEKVAFLESLSK